MRYPLNGKTLLSSFFKGSQTYFKETLLNLNHGKLVPSPHDIRIIEAQSKMVVLTHGTDTMIEVNIFTD